MSFTNPKKTKWLAFELSSFLLTLTLSHVTHSFVLQTPATSKTSKYNIRSSPLIKDKYYSTLHEKRTMYDIITSEQDDNNDSAATTPIVTDSKPYYIRKMETLKNVLQTDIDENDDRLSDVLNISTDSSKVISSLRFKKKEQLDTENNNNNNNNKQESQQPNQEMFELFESDLLKQSSNFDSFIQGKDNANIYIEIMDQEKMKSAATTNTLPLKLEGINDNDKEVTISQEKDNVSDSNDKLNDNIIWKARFLVLAAAALYGTNFSIVKILDESVPISISNILRFGLASLVTLPWLFGSSTAEESPNQSNVNKAGRNNNYSIIDDIKAALLSPTTPQSNNLKLNDISQVSTNLERSFPKVFVLLAGMEIGLWNSIGYIYQAIGLQSTCAGKSAFICSLAVVTVPILDYIFKSKKMEGKAIIGAILAVVGVGFLELDGLDLMSNAQHLTAPSSGELATLVQPLVFGMGFWRMESAMNKYPDEVLRLTASQLFAVFLASIFYFVFSTTGADFGNVAGEISNYVSDPMILGAIVWTGIFTTALTIYMETSALKTLTAAEVTMIFSTEPLFGAGFASLLVGEHFGLGGAVGAIMILGGCIFSNIGLDFMNKNTPISLSSQPDEDEIIIADQ